MSTSRNTIKANAKLTRLTIFVGSPGDCIAEHDIVEDVAKELEVLANHHGYTLKIRDWQQVAPDMGRPQHVIFDQLPVTEWDIFVGVLWLRFGMPSGGMNPITCTPAESGTEEEFAAALESYRATGRPRILFYRRTEGPADMSRFDVSQFNLVQQFFKKFETGQPYEGLYKSYATPEEFRKKLREHLLALLVNTGIDVNLDTQALARERKTIDPNIISGWRERLLTTYDVLKLHRISSAYDAGSVLRADRDRVRLHDVFIPQHVSDVTAFVAERLPAPHDLRTAREDELRLLGMLHHRDLQKAKRYNVFNVIGLEKNKRIVLLGNPGAGKSSLLQHRALTWARDSSGRGPIPLLLEMRQYAARVARAREERKPQPTLLEWGGELLGSSVHLPALSEPTLASLLVSGGAVLYCDALDEVFDPALRFSTAEQIAQLAARIPGAQIVVTSRPVGYPDDVLSTKDFSHWMVQDFNADQIRAFLDRWVMAALPDYDDRSNVMARMDSALQIPRVREMAGNPLLLTLMSILARTDELPRNRMRLYAKAAELLLYQWDTSRSLRPISGLDFAYEQKHRVLRELAWQMQNAQLGLGGNLAPLEMVRNVFDDELQADLDRPGDRARGVSLLLETLRERDHVLCHLGGDRFAFVHRGFLEYFCADWLYERVRRSPSTAENDLFDIFNRYARTAVWGEVLGLGTLALAPEVADPMLSRIKDPLLGRGLIPQWLSDAVLLDEKSKARYPRTAAALRSNLKLALSNVRRPRVIVEQLIRFWPDDETHLLLAGMIKDPSLSEELRRVAINRFAPTWPDNDTRSLLITIALTEFGPPSRAAVIKLATLWQDEEIRQTLKDVSIRSDAGKSSASAIHQLAKFWPDDDTKTLLENIAERHDGSHACRAANYVLNTNKRFSKKAESNALVNN